jgi:hypothetical protein
LYFRKNLFFVTFPNDILLFMRLAVRRPGSLRSKSMYTFLYLLGIGALILVALGLQQVPISENRRRIGGIVSGFPAPVTFAATSSGAAVSLLTGIGSTSGLQVGMLLLDNTTPTHISVPSYITAITATTITISGVTDAAFVGDSFTAYPAFGGSSAAQVHLFGAP